MQNPLKLIFRALVLWLQLRVRFERQLAQIEIVDRGERFRAFRMVRLLHKQVGEFNYLNLDGLALGGVLFLPRSTQVSLSAGYGQVTFARERWDAMGTNKDDGLAVSTTVRKEWPFARRWALGVGVQASLFRTFEARYTFLTFSMVGLRSFYLTPVI